MSKAKSKSNRLSWGQDRLLRMLCEERWKLIYFLPIIVPTILFILAFLLFNITVLGTPVKELRASYPRVYEVITVSSQRWPPRVEIKTDFCSATDGISNLIYVTVSRIKDYRYRFIWFAAIFSFFVFAVSAIFICEFIIFKSLYRRLYLRFNIFIMIISLFIILIGAIHSFRRCEQFLDNWKIENADLLELHLIAHPLRYLDPLLGFMAWNLHIGFQVLLGITMLMLALAATATVAEPPNDAKLTPDFLKEQMHRGQIFLYTGCTLLTVSIVYVAVWHRWPVELLPETEPLREELADHATVVVAARGVLASLLLLGAYVPMALIHSVQARKIARDELEPKSKPTEKQKPSPDITNKAIADFLEKNRLQIPILTQIQRIGAMLLPALISPVMSILATLTSGS